MQLLVLVAAVAGTRWQDFLRLPSESASEDDDAAAVGTRWAVLIAGSNGYYNYRHQVKLSITGSMDDDLQACLVLFILAALPTANLDWTDLDSSLRCLK